MSSLLLAMGLREPLTMVELALSGGTAAGLCGLRWQPGCVDLAAAAATAGEVRSSMVAQHAQHPLSGVPVVVGPANALEAVSAATVLAPMLTRYLGHTSGLLVTDCGQLGPRSALWSVAVAADVTLLVVRGGGDQGETAARLFHARALSNALAADAARLGLVVVGEDVQAVAGQLGLPLVAAIPLRPEVVAAVRAGVAARDRGGVGKVIDELADRTRALAETDRAGLVLDTDRLGARR